MTNSCVCGHLTREHHMDYGRCEAEEDTLWGPKPCHCPHFEQDSD